MHGADGPVATGVDQGAWDWTGGAAFRVDSPALQALPLPLTLPAGGASSPVSTGAGPVARTHYSSKPQLIGWPALVQ